MRRALALLLPCFTAAIGNDALAQRASAPSAVEQDAMRFTQDFLRRYLGQFEESPERAANWNPLDGIREDLSPGLLAALAADRDASIANDDEIVGLDFDPFINAQDVCEAYEARAAVARDTTTDVGVYNTCDWGHPLIPDVIYQLQRHGDRWMVVDLRYGGGQSLLEVLAYYAEQRKRD